MMDDPRSAGQSEQNPEMVAKQSPANRGRLHQLAAQLVLTGLGVWIVMQSLELQLFNALGVGPGMFPLVSGLLIAGLAGVGTSAELWHIARHEPDRDDEPPAVALFEIARETASLDTDSLDESRGDPVVEESWETVRWAKFWIAVACVVSFVMVVGYVGFVIAITALTFALLTLTARRSLLFSVLTAVGVGVAVWWGFGELLAVRFPDPSIPFFAALFS